VLIVSVLTNYWLKIIIANERPPSSYWYPGADAPSFSTPSGHSQLSASLYGWFAVRIKTWWMALLWGLGILIVICFYRLEKPAREFFSQYKFEHLLLSVFFIGLLMTVIAALLPPPPNDNFGALGGLTMGLALGLALENRFVGFSVEAPNGQKWRLVLRVAIGLALVIGVMFGLSPILPSEDLLLRTVRYFLTAITGIFVWPLIFKKVNL